MDSSERVLFSAFVKPTKPVVSYLTPITGISASDLAGALPRGEALQAVQQLLGPDVLLVGQSLQADVDWLCLVKGTHYHSLHDLAETFKAYSKRFSNHVFFSLEHTATVLLGMHMRQSGGGHDPALDALASVRLYQKYATGPRNQLDAARTQLLRNKAAPSVAKELNYTCDGVCMAAFYKAMCTCGQAGVA